MSTWTAHRLQVAACQGATASEDANIAGRRPSPVIEWVSGDPEVKTSRKPITQRADIKGLPGGHAPMGICRLGHVVAIIGPGRRCTNAQNVVADRALTIELASGAVTRGVATASPKTHTQVQM
jgi:hypothetical protein